MAKEKIGFEWQVVEDDEIWDSLQIPNEPPATKRRWPLGGERWLGIRLLQGFCLVGLAWLITAGASFSPDQHARLIAQTGIQTSLDLEAQARQINDKSLFNRLLDDQVSKQTQSDWRNAWTNLNQNEKILAVEPHGDLALVKVLVTQPNTTWWRPNAVRETRFYRQTDEGWVRTVPPETFWGQEQTAETAHLRFVFTTYDAQNVQPLVEQMETVYVKLHQLLGLPLPTDEKLLLVVKPATNTPWVDSTGKQLELASPATSSVPDNLSDQTYLAQTIGGRLITQAVTVLMSKPGETYNYRWRTMQRAVTTWLRADLLQQRAPWYDQAKAAFRQESEEFLPLKLTDLNTWRAGQPSDRTHILMQSIAAESFINYTINTYGQDRLSALLQGFSQDEKWDDLIPHVFGQSVAAFEAGWNQYVEQHYGVSGVNS